MNKEEELIDRLIDLAFAEDIGDGDHTTLSCIPATAMGKSKLLIKEPGILAGIEIAKEVFRRFDPTMKVEVFINDGTAVKPGDDAIQNHRSCNGKDLASNAEDLSFCTELNGGCCYRIGKTGNGNKAPGTTEFADLRVDPKPCENDA